MMSNPYDPQRREAPEQAFENIQERLFRKFGPRIATGDFRPIRGMVQFLPNGLPGGRPIPAPAPLMAPISRSLMPALAPVVANKARTASERAVNAARFLEKRRITLLQLDKPTALDAANRVRYKPATYDKPAPPVNWQGGFRRVKDRDVEHPKNTTSVSMQPLSTVAARWQRMLLPNSSVPSSATVRLPKTL